MNKLCTFIFIISLLASLESADMDKPIDHKKCVTVLDKEFSEYISQEQIAQRIKELAQQISNDYAGQKPIFIAVLKGAFIIMSDLVRELSIDCEVDFMKISSYGDAITSSGTVTLKQDISCSIADRDVIIVEDIVDSGLSIQFVHEHLSKSNPSSIRIASLLNKQLATLNFPIDYVAFEIPSDFVVGYGLDYAQVGRNLKAIYKLVE